MDHTNSISKFINFFKKLASKIILWINKIIFNFKIKNSVRYSTDILTNKSNRYQYIVSSFRDAVNESSSSQILEHDRKKKIIDEINSYIYGALGEQKVVKELEKLSDDYTLINDFTCSFNPPLYNRQENDYIKSVQIDHLLISPSGIFVIETKNWSEDSLNNLSLFSPVQQIKRTSFALYKILIKAINNSNLHLLQHHWGNRKIPIRNLIVLINQKPKEDFQYVKILTLNELLDYVEYFAPSFSKNETEVLVEYLLNIKTP